MGGALKYGGSGMPYFTDAERRVSAEVRWCEFSLMAAKSALVSCNCAVLVGEWRREDGQERVECVRRFT